MTNSLADLDRLSTQLALAGFIAADEEANLMLTKAGSDPRLLQSMLGRRLTGEPLAWILGETSFCGSSIKVMPGVYVPRPQTELLARRALERLPEKGVAIDLCTGSGAIARTLGAAKPMAHVIATDIDAAAVECARANGVCVYEGDLFSTLPHSLKSSADVIVAVPPYVPTDQLGYLQRDTFKFESPLSYDGGTDGTALLGRIVSESVTFLRAGGALLLELGGRQDRLISDSLRALGYSDVQLFFDEEGDLRGLEALFNSG